MVLTFARSSSSARFGGKARKPITGGSPLLAEDSLVYLGDGVSTTRWASALNLDSALKINSHDLGSDLKGPNDICDYPHVASGRDWAEKPDGLYAVIHASCLRGYPVNPRK